MKLLIVTQVVDMNDPILGFFHNWILELAYKFEKVHVICLKEGDHSLPANVVVHSLGKENGVSKIAYVANFYRYTFSLRKEYDHVFVHMNPIYVPLGSPVWITLRKKVSLWYTHKEVDLKLRIATFLADKIFTASKESFRINSDKVAVVGHGIDTDLFRYIPKSKNGVFRISTIGRISATKDIAFLVRAFSAALRSARAPMVFDIVGSPTSPVENEYKKGLIQLIDERGLSGKVIFKGAVMNRSLGEYLNTLDLTLNAGKTGSFDKSVLESMSCGVPVMASNEAFRELLEPFGMFFKEGDEAALAKMIVDRSERGTSEDESQRLRKAVIEGHSLKRLIDVLSGIIKSQI